MDLRFGYVPGCIGRIVELHGAYYAREAGFGVAFETKVAADLAAFCQRRAAGSDALWLAEHEGRIHGSIAIDASQYPESGAHLRWFIVSDEVRGQGVGTDLLEAALGFCKEHNYRKVYLWTFAGLHAARHLYEKRGFRLSRTQRGTQWGKEVDEQLFLLGDD